MIGSNRCTHCSFNLHLIVQFLVLSFRQSSLGMPASAALTVSSFNIGGDPQPYGVIPELDTDVLEAICGSIDGIHDLLAVSLTCSLMWGIATRELLRTHTIHLTTRKAIRSFRIFIFNHNTTHAHHLRSLVIPEIVWLRGATILSNDAGHLMDILDRAVKLDNLCLCFADEFHAEPARISSAFAGLSVLTSLSLIDPGQHWAHLALNALQAPLRTLCVRAAHKLSVLPPPSPDHYFQMFLRFSTSATLTNLHLAQIPMYNNSFRNLPQFHSVRSLGITSPLEREPRLNALLHLFPSLDGTLYFCQALEQSIRHSMNPTMLHEIQEENWHSQDVLRWAGLDRLECSSATARMLSLRCPAVIGIRPKHLVTPANHCICRLSLHHARRRHLVVSFEGLLTWKSAIRTSLRLLLGRRLLRRLTRPPMHASCHEHLMRNISPFQDATHVRLIFHFDKEGAWGNVLDRFMRDARAHAFESVAGRPQQLAPPPHILAACPELRHFFVTVAGRDDTQVVFASAPRRWIHTRAWRVVESAAGEGGKSAGTVGQGNSATARPSTVLEELSEDAARRVIEAEGLGLPEEWERKLEACRTPER
ncbi:hypothetical protein V8D89_009901 [Ganoderma adspersum]